MRLISLLLLASVALSSPPRQNLYRNPGAASFFIDTAVDWHSVNGGSPQKFNTAQRPITGYTTIVGFYGSGDFAAVSGYFNYDPKTKTFAFVPSRELTVHLGNWKRTEAGQLEVEQKFAYDEHLATAVECKTHEESCVFRKEPGSVAAWSVTRDAKGNVISVGSPMKDVSSFRHYIVVTKLRNLRKLNSTIEFAENTLSRHLNSSPQETGTLHRKRNNNSASR